MKRGIFSLVLFICFLLCMFSINADGKARVLVKPSEVIVEPGQKVPFSVGLLKNGEIQRVLPWDFKYSAEKGHMSRNIYTAPEQPGTYIIIIRCTKAKAVGIAKVNVKAKQSVARMVIEPSNTKVEVRSKIRFRAKVYSSSGKEISFSPAWVVYPRKGKIDADGNFLAGEKTGKCTILAIGPGKLKAKAKLEIVGENVPQLPVLTRIEILPKSNEIRSGERGSFRALAYDQHGKKMNANFLWKASHGQIDRHGNYWAKETGKVWVIASSQGVEAKHRFTVLPALSVLTKFFIWPQRAKLRAGESLQFRAKALDQYGKVLSPKVYWKANGGEIDRNGRFIAGDRTGNFTIFAASGKFRSKAEVKIIPLPSVLTRLRVFPEKIELKPNAQMIFRVIGYDQYGKKIQISVQWKASGGTIDGKGKYLAPEKPGIYHIVAIGPKSLSKSAKVKVVQKASVASKMRIFPHKLKLKSGGQAVFRALCYDQYGKRIQVSIDWKATGGEIRSNGVYLAPQNPGRYYVTAIGPNNLSKMALIDVEREASVLKRISIFPAKIKIKSSGQAVFRAICYDQYGKRMQIGVEWKASGGKITQKGIYVAPKIPGNYYVTAIASQNLSRSAKVTVIREASILTRIKIFPSTLKLKAGDSIRFQARGYDQYGKQMHVDVRWQSTIGTIDHRGVLRAPNRAGEGKVMAISDGITAMAKVSFVLPLPTLAKIEVTPSKAKAKAGKRIFFEAQGYDQYGRKISVRVKWKTTGGQIDAEGGFISNQSGKFEIIAQAIASKIKGKADVTIVSGSQYTLIATPKKIRVRPGKKIRYQLSLYRNNKEIWTWPWEYKFSYKEGSFSIEDTIYTAP